jgi:GNAT superfamily N-acetyltransferase
MASAESARARFDTATAAHLTAPLADGITVRHAAAREVIAASEALWAKDARPPARLDALFSAEQNAQLADLGAVQGEPLSHHLLIERGGETVGAYWGQQHPFGRYYMVNTILRPDLQGRGIYRALLPRLIAAATDAGFAEVYSRHRVDNNAILVPKLKAGFVIAAFEITPRYGLLVHLRRYLVEGLDQTFRNRIDGAHAAELRAKNVLPTE